MVDPLPDVVTKAPGITVETIEGADSAAVDSEGDPLEEDFVGFAVDSIRDPRYPNCWIMSLPALLKMLVYVFRRIERTF